MVPQLLYGTAWKEERTAELAGLALTAGFRGLDTANQPKHYNEAGAGRAIADAFRSGLVRREDLFVQTKFTPADGQDHRVPYDPGAPRAEQVRLSMASSLEHLGADYIDSYLLHGPASGFGWTPEDDETWRAMIAERDAGRARRIGVSNVSLRHLEQMAARHAEPPAFVQNRCFARTGWDRQVRAFCRQRGIVYQGFSLLTANRAVLKHPPIEALAQARGVTPAQVIFGFAIAVGMLPLTGTTSMEHMRQDLASASLALAPAEVELIESIAG